jgi:hypothetical protein
MSIYLTRIGAEAVHALVVKKKVRGISLDRSFHSNDTFTLLLVLF